MKLNVEGEYTIKIPIQSMFLNSNILIKNKNIITTLGESFFLNRMINDNFTPIEYIVIGTAMNKPKKSDMSLGNETIRKKCNKETNLNKKQIVLTANFPITEIFGASEIGVTNGSVLISHDVFERLDDNILTPTSGDVNITYTYNLSTGNFKTGWEVATGYPNVYYIVESTPVNMVYEDNGISYNRVNSKSEVSENAGTFYYDISSKNLYINSSDCNPNDKNIIVQTK